MRKAIEVAVVILCVSALASCASQRKSHRPNQPQPQPVKTPLVEAAPRPASKPVAQPAPSEPARPQQGAEAATAPPAPAAKPKQVAVEPRSRFEPKAIDSSAKGILIQPLQPFEWQFELRGLNEVDAVLKELHTALAGTRIAHDQVVVKGKSLRVVGVEAYELLQPLLERMGIAPKRDRIKVEVVSVVASADAEFGLSWRLVATRPRASAVTQYALLDASGFDACLNAVRDHKEQWGAEVTTHPQATLLDGRRATLRSLSRCRYVADYEIAAGDKGARFVPVTEEAALGQSLDLGAHVLPRGAVLLDVKVVAGRAEGACASDYAGGHPTLLLNARPNRELPVSMALGVSLPVQDSLVRQWPVADAQFTLPVEPPSYVAVRVPGPRPQTCRVWIIGTSIVAPPTPPAPKVQLPPGLGRAFMLPHADADQYGNPVVARDGKRIDPATGWPYEIWLKQPRMEFVLVPAGEFSMGSPSGEKDRDSSEGPAHRVRISKPFYLGKYEVTNGQYRCFKPDHNSKDYCNHSLNADDQPAAYISWNSANEFCKWLGQKTGVLVLLPTEAQWEYACGAGAKGRFYWGDSESKAGQYANVADRAGKLNWEDWEIFATDDGYAVAAPVGRFKPNPLGLYDMLGNVWEWCADGKRAYSTSAETDPRGPEGGKRVLRGGCWLGEPKHVRRAERFDYDPTGAWNAFGFRVLLAVGGGKP